MLDPNYMHYRQAAKKLGLAPASVLRYFHGGTLEGRNSMNSVWITAASVERYQRNRKPAGRPRKPETAGI